MEGLAETLYVDAEDIRTLVSSFVDLDGDEIPYDLLGGEDLLSPAEHLADAIVAACVFVALIASATAVAIVGAGILFMFGVLP